MKINRTIKFCVDDMATASSNGDELIKNFIEYVIAGAISFRADVAVGCQYSPRFMFTEIIINLSIEQDQVDAFKNMLLRNKLYASTMKYIEAGSHGN